MPHSNTMPIGRYIWKNLLYVGLSMILYHKIFLVYGNYQHFLYLITTGGVLLGILLHLKNNRNSQSIAVNILLPFGIYTAFAYYQVSRGVFLAALVLAGGMSALSASMILCRRIRSKKKRQRILLSRIHRSLSCTQFFFAAGLSCAALCLCVIIWAGADYTVPPAKAIEMQPENSASDESTDFLLQFQDEVWYSLSAKERLHLLQMITQRESRQLGIPHSLQIRAVQTENNVLGYYCNERHEISISLNSMLHDPPAQVINTVCHETYHGYQHCIVEAWKSLPEEATDLQLFDDAKRYAKEFDNYQTADLKFENYYQQKCETDARNYAKQAMEKYNRIINVNVRIPQTDTDFVHQH